MHIRRPNDPLVEYIPFPRSMEQIHADLSGAQIEQLMEYALDLLSKGDKDQATRVVLAIALLTTHGVDQCLHEFIANEVYYPGSMFWSAGESVSEALTQRLKGDRLRLNHILTALAWSGNETAVTLFQKWKKRPPPWATDLYVPVHAYAEEGAGRSMTEAISASCFCAITSASGNALRTSHQSYRLCVFIAKSADGVRDLWSASSSWILRITDSRLYSARGRSCPSWHVHCALPLKKRTPISPPMVRHYGRITTSNGITFLPRMRHKHGMASQAWS